MPGHTRQRIRRTHVAKVADFDDQLWPINVAILILAGFVVGLVFATSDFHDPRILYNGWVHAAVVGLLVGVAFWAVFWLQGKIVRRVQLCVLVSLLAHLWLGIYLHDQYLAMVALEETHRMEQAFQQPNLKPVPDYHWDGLQPLPVRKSFEDPVETESPEPSETEPVEKPIQDESPVTVPEPVEPETPQPQQPDPAEIRRAELSAPRRAELAAGAQVSRQQWKHRPEPDEPIPQPAIQPEGRQTPSTLRPQVAAVDRRREQPAMERQTFHPQPSARRQDAMKLARRAASSDPVLETPTTQTPTRQLDRPADVARAEAAEPDPIRVVRRPEPPVPQANPMAARRQLEAPDPVRQTSDPTAAQQIPVTASAPALASALARRSDPSEPQLAEEAASPSRPSTLARADRSATNLPSTALAAEEVATPAAVGSAPASQLDVSRTAALRRPTEQASQGPAPSAAGAEHFAVGSASLAARMGQPRASGRGRPSVAANAQALRIARSPAGTPAPVTPRPQVAEVSSLAAASGRGGPVSPSADAQATALGRVGSVGIPARNPAPTIGMGPATTSGASGLAGAVALARVPGDDARFSARAGGGTPRPARSFGRAFAGDARADLPEQVTSAPSGGRDAGPQLDARLSGQQRQVAGLPGSLTGQPASGALLAMTASGASRRTASARRAVAAQQEPGSAGMAPAARATLARTRQGTDLPAAAMATENAFDAGAAGLAASQGSSASGLDVGANTSIRRQSADVPAARTASAAGMEALGTGAADVVAMAGPATKIGESFRNPAAAHGRSADSPGEATASPPADTASAEGPAATTPGTTPGPRRRPPGDEPGPSLAADVGGGPLKKTTSPGLLRGLATAARAESIAVAEVSDPGDFEVAAGPRMGGPSRREGGLPVQVAASAGPGGLSLDPSPVVGIPSRRARPESEIVYPVSRRFVIERSGGRLAVDGRILEEPADMFRQRAPQRRARTAEKFGGTASTEQAVEAGLDFLARHQFPDGRWAIDRFPNSERPGYEDAAPGQMNSDTAATGLALLAFLGAGYTHQDEKHRTVVRRGLDWLIENQQPGGQLFTNASDQTRYAQSYAHGIAAIALCEAYGMTRDPELREPAEKAIQYIYDAQHPTRGGWRYTPRDGEVGWAKESDTSVSGWQLMAMKSAQMAGLPIREDVLENVSRWLDSAQVAGARYTYNPHAADTPEQRRGLVPNNAMTAEGLLMRMYLGWQRDNPSLVEGAEFLKANLPDVGTESAPLRDCYYWYYATQVMFHMQGDYWDAWNGRLHPLLESSQLDAGPMAGSWNPDQPIHDRWGHAGGRLYVTTMHLLMLEVYYRHLPLFQTLK